jgi:LytS/YehU family sensor histidine kinase
VVTVSDAGAGILPDRLGSLFDARPEDAHALPLLARRLRALFPHRDALAAHSAPEKGASVVLRLPYSAYRREMSRGRPTAPADRRLSALDQARLRVA